MEQKYKKRRAIGVLAGAGVILLAIFLNPASYQKVYINFGESSDASSGPDMDSDGSSTDSNSTGENSNTGVGDSSSPLASEILEKLEVKGRAPKTGYARTEFYDSWPTENGCNLRQRILKRDFGETAKLASDNCTVISGSLYEPYTGTEMTFTEKAQISKGLQIDHVVALSDAWQKGAQYKTKEERFALATDPMNLIAVDSSANQQKSDGDAATWLPKNKSFRCQYVSRQVSVKYKYGLWVTSAEKDAISRVLSSCPNERATI